MHVLASKHFDVLAIYIYIYIYICVCVCVCVFDMELLRSPQTHLSPSY